MMSISCYENTELEECGDEKGRFINGQHFIPARFLNDEKRIEYLSWYKYLKNREKFYPNCIPIKREESLEEKLHELEKVISVNP